jgi:hypothetical protein
MNTLHTYAPRLLAGFGTAALVIGVGLFASSRPAHTAGGPIPVSIANLPLPTTGPALQPVDVYIHAYSTTNQSYGNLVYTVPAGKRLVVESMTLIQLSLADNTISYTGFVLNEAPNGTVVSVASLSAPANIGAMASVTQPMHFHVGPGGAVEVNVFRPDTGSINVYVSLAGYLVDVP